jgi:Flp pilus assembly protein TadG
LAGARAPFHSRAAAIAVALTVALLLPILIGFVGLAVDFGHAWEVRCQLHYAADAAAMAGVRDLDH